MDAIVRSDDIVRAGSDPNNARRAPVAASLTEQIRKQPGVAAASAEITGPGQLTGSDGKPVGGGGPPVRAGNWITDPKLNPYTLARGRAPRTDSEVVINRGAARTGKLEVGDRTVLRTPDPVRVTVVGIATFDGADGLGPTTFTAFTTSAARRHLMADPETVSSVQVRAEAGVTADQLVRRLDTALPDSIDVISGAESAEEAEQNISGAFLDLFTALLLVFAGIALLVATFSIHNTFAVVLAQRTRENALLRAIGASRRQLLAATLLESLVVGLLASAVGLGGGFGMATLLKVLFSSMGWPLPSGGIAVSTTSVLLPLLVGTLVTAFSALMPALRASRVAPLAAVRDAVLDRPERPRVRLLTGLLLGAAGVLGTLIGTGTLGADGASLILTSVGAVLVLAAFVVLGPVAAAPTARWLGALPARLFGVPARLARDNAVRNPRRTAATATALMVGGAVVAMFTVFGASLGSTLERTADRSFAGDAAVSASGFGSGGAGIGPGLARELRQLPEVAGAVGIGEGIAEVDGRGRQLTATDPARLAALVELGTVDGRLDRLGRNGLAVSAKEAKARGLRLGDTVRIGFTDGSRSTLGVRAVYERTDLVGSYLTDRAAWTGHGTRITDRLVAADFAPGTGTAAGTAALKAVAEDYGNPPVQTRQQYIKESGEGISMMLTAVYALLALAVLIALMGIANTLTLAVHERTREIGLLRAVGETRRQARSMIRWESLLVAAFGTAGGMGLGTFLGWALLAASDSSGESVFTLPWMLLAGVAAVGLAAGVLAGLRPARRAARLDPLRALAAT
jgi:putative ABC transport system permease protein